MGNGVAADQMYWQCNRRFVGEDGCRFDPSYFSLESIIRGEQLPLSACGMTEENTALTFVEGWNPALAGVTGRWNGGWLSVIENYTARKLAMDYDKLPAVSGLAHVINEKTKDEY
jgi:hypothetical protein